MEFRTSSSRWLIGAMAIVLSIGLMQALHFPNNLFSDHPFLKELAEKLDEHQDHYRAEKVYVHLDKPLYKPGESIWLSAYVRDALTLEASDQSDIVYVELLNPRGAVEKKLDLIAHKGQAAGDFQLPESIKGGTYKIKAYTQWQKNSEAFFERDIQIQKVVLPNLNMQLNFERDAYGPGAKASAQLKLESLDKQALANHEYKYVLSLAGNNHKTGSGTTDAGGLATVAFDLPKDLKTSDGLLNIMFTYKGQTESISRSVPIVLGNIDLQFFPEGGQLLNNIVCNVGFKAVDEFGKPADVAGVIVDETGKEVTDFRSYHKGMGKVEFRPLEGHQYKARITSPAVAAGMYDLPKAKEAGIAIRLRGQTKYQIQLDVLSSKKEELFVVAQSGSKMQFSYDFEAFPGVNSIAIPTSNFPVGITQITVFDSEKVARAERLAFVNQYKQLHISVKTNKEQYLPREMVEMEIQVHDERGQPVAGQFSVAVADDKLLTFADDKQGHILAYTLLESDIQGEIEEPNFYFDDESDPKRLKPEVERAVALDHLLMTQGWRKFVWKDIQQEKMAKMTHQAEGAVFAGTVKNTKGEAVKGATVQITGMASTTTTDAEGNFVLEEIDLYQPVNLMVRAPKLYPQQRTLTEYAKGLNFKLIGKRVLQGKVIDEKTKKAVANANLQVHGGSQYVNGKSDENGNYKLEFPENSSQLYVYYNGNNKYINLTSEKGEQLDIKINTERQIVKPTRPNFFGNRKAKLAKGAGRVPQKDRVLNEAFGGAPDPVAPIVEEDVHMDMAVEDIVLDAPVEKELEKAEEKVADEEVAELEPVEEEFDLKMDIQGKALGGLVAQKDMRERQRQAVRYYRARKFYAPKYESKKQPEVRNDFRSTVYWNPSVSTGTDGRAKIQFYNSDDITQFRVTVEGFGNAGQIGRVEYKYFIQLPVELTTKIPAEVLTGDKVYIPITLTNNTDAAINGELNVELPAHIQLIQLPQAAISLAAKEGKTFCLQGLVTNLPASGKLKISFVAKGLKDQIEQDVAARPRGFPVRALYAGDQLKSKFTLSITEPIEGSLSATVKVFPNTLDQVMGSMESMLRMPGGCFEQTSSSNYPNLLALNYLRETNTSNPDLEKKAMKYLKVGYGRLTGYESPAGGFDWWGRDPGHEALTAYGLLQFIDMKTVYPVEEKLINRTTKWLMNRRDGKGSWKLNPNCLHSWATSEITDAYIVWALTEAGLSDKIKKEIDKSYKDAVKSEDPYLMGLVVNALYNAKDKRAGELMRELVKTQKEEGHFEGLNASVVNSRGNSLIVETTGLAALAMMKANQYKAELAKAIQSIQAKKSYYGYGSTQGTVLALKAILGYTKMSKRATEDGTLAVLVNGKKVISKTYKADDKEINIPELTPFLTAGNSKIELRYEGTKSPMPFEVELTYNTRMPNNSKECKLALSTTLPKTTVNTGETVRLQAKLSSKADENQPMAMAMIGIPAGLSVQMWQLKELKEKGAFDYYELFDGYVVLHYEYLKPAEQKLVNLDLKADIPGEYEAPASSAFLYYTNEHRVWSKPDRMTIN